MRTAADRDLVGYGRDRPAPQWPGGARLALNIAVNIEEGAEDSVPDGASRSESPLTDAGTAGADVPGRDLAAESMMAYGSRVGFWRVLRLLTERGMPATASACAVALERNPQIAAAAREAGWDLLGHGHRFTKHYLLTEDAERAELAAATASFRTTWGAAPTGWYCRYGPSLRTRQLLLEHGGFSYDSDAYDDELPYWTRVSGRDHLVVPHTFSNNDNKYAKGWWATSDDAFTYLRDAFDVLYAEGGAMMVVSVHPRLTGHPARAAGLARFLDHVAAHPAVWVTTRSAIAEHWAATHPAPTRTGTAS
ncbi:polysaccharide deacetylase family protein [Nocardioides sp. 616]|uniref:polysaccharide deacetylase family protein n=1 Tax=Nocardioides sp. 616 TaxID=2268090 RepID=UPI000CE4D2E5|nr:polysaccharide deacetylase family protein [Nocardioides sp. 616]